MTTFSHEKLVIIPARMGSRRFPGKPLALIAGHTMLWWAWHNASNADVRVIVATPDREIASFCREQKIPWFPTRPSCPSGTHRCSEVLKRLKPDCGVKYVLNLQCDLPFITPDIIDSMFELVADYPQLITTICGDLSEDRIEDRNAVKMVGVQRSPERRIYEASWFSRMPLPRSVLHYGAYGFSTEMLEAIGALSPSINAEAESLEQLTWLDNGHRIIALHLQDPLIEIDDEVSLRSAAVQIIRLQSG